MLGVGRVSVRVTFVDREGKEGAEGRGRGTKEEAETQEEGEEELFVVDETHASKEGPEETDTLTSDNGGDTDTHALRPSLEASLPTHAPTTVSSLQFEEAIELGELPEVSTVPAFKLFTTGAMATARSFETTAICLTDLPSKGASNLLSTGASESTAGRPASMAAEVVPNPKGTQ